MEWGISEEYFKELIDYFKLNSNRSSEDKFEGYHKGNFRYYIKNYGPDIDINNKSRYYTAYLRFIIDPRKQSTHSDREVKKLLPIFMKFGIDKGNKIRQAIGYYGVTGYARMNNALRSGKLATSSIKLIDEYIKLAPKYTGSTLYRGVSSEVYEIVSNSNSSDFIDKGFISVTHDYEFAEWFARRKKKGAVFILTGATSKAVAEPVLSSRSDDSTEWIMPRDTRFHITKIVPPERGKVGQIHATIK